MADMNVTEARKNILLDAVYELDKLSRVMPDLIPVDESQNHYAVRGICGRMLRLTSILMTGLDDPDEPDDSLKCVLDFSATGQA